MGYGLGIDLGTTFTAAAVVVDGRPEVVSLGDRAAEVPSVVFLRDEGQPLVGEPALRRGAREPDRLAREFKRRLGDPTPLILGGHPVPAERLTGLLLRWVVDEVTERQGVAPDRIVVTVPAVWGPFRLEMIKSAIVLSGVGKADTAPEPVAAALHFASSERIPLGQTVAIYDLGGGTFDAAVLRNTDRGFELLGTPTGLEHLGGVDFDEAVLTHVLTTLGDGVSDLDPDDPELTEALVQLRHECTDAKEHLSVDTEAVVQVALPGIRRGVRLTRGEFEEMIRPSVDETVASLRRALASADVTPEDLNAVVLVGGSARVPLVSQLLGHELGRPVALSPAPKHAVALGAAVIARGDTGPPDAERRRLGGAGARVSAPVEPLRSTGASRHAVAQQSPPPATRVESPGAAADARAEATAPTGAQSDTARGALPPAPERATPFPRETRRAWIRRALAVLPILAVLLAIVVPLLLHRDGREQADVEVGRFSAELPADDVDSGVVTPRLSLRLLGLQLNDYEAERTGNSVDVTGSPPGALGSLGTLLAGPVSATVSDADEPTLLRFPQPWPGLAVTVLLALFVLAYTESLLRGVRRHRRARAVDLVGMGVMGALAGVVLALVGWATSGLLAVEGARVLAGGVVLLGVGFGVCLAVHAAETSRRGRRPSPNRP